MGLSWTPRFPPKTSYKWYIFTNKGQNRNIYWKFDVFQSCFLLNGPIMQPLTCSVFVQALLPMICYRLLLQPMMCSHHLKTHHQWVDSCALKSGDNVGNRCSRRQWKLDYTRNVINSHRSTRIARHPIIAMCVHLLLERPENWSVERV